MPLLLRLALGLGLLVDRRRRPRFLLALDNDVAHLAGLEQTAFKEPVHQGAMLLLVLVRQGILIRAQRDNDVLATRLRIGNQANGQFRHFSSPSGYSLPPLSPRGRGGTTL